MGKSNRIKMGFGSSDKTVQEAFGEFMLYSKSKNLSKRTLEYYEMNNERLEGFLQTKSISLIKDVTAKVFDQFKLSLQGQINNSTSINTVLRAVRAFLYYSMKLDYLKEFKIELVKTQKKIKETYSDAELKLLLEKPNLRKCNFSTYRNWVLTNYFLGTGNRLSSVLNIKIRDLDLENGMVKLRKTKNKQEQLIPLSQTLVRVLQEYLSFRKGEPEDYLFCTNTGTKLSLDGLTSAIARYNNRRGVSKTSVHLYRHTFAKKWILNGGDLFRLQKILGHSSIEIVKEYVNMFTDDIKKDIDRFNPLEQFTATKQVIRLG